MVKRLKVRGTRLGTSLRPTFPGENSITVVQEMAQQPHSPRTCRPVGTGRAKRLDEKWAQTPPRKANICHRWRADGVLIRAQGCKSFEPIHPNWAAAGRSWNQSAVASSGDEGFFLSAGMCDSFNQQHRCCYARGEKKETTHSIIFERCSNEQRKKPTD